MTVPAPETGGNDQVIDQGFHYLKPDQGQQQEDQQLQGQQQPQEVKLNPAWDSLLSTIPQQYHQAVLPTLKQWDQNYDSGIQKVHSQYADYKPFIEQQIAPDDMNNALLVWQSMNDNPEKFIQTIMEYYGYNPQGGQGQNPQQPQETTEDDGIPFDITQDPRFQEMSNMVQLLSQAQMTQYEAQQAQEVEQEVAQMFDDAKSRLGEFDEAYVAQLLMINEGMDIDTAIQLQRERDQQLVQTYRSPGQNAPVLMGGGGGLPSQQTRVSGLTGQQRRNLIVQSLENMDRTGG
jgi:hypothetical protein